MCNGSHETPCSAPNGVHNYPLGGRLRGWALHTVEQVSISTSSAPPRPRSLISSVGSWIVLAGVLVEAGFRGDQPVESRATVVGGDVVQGSVGRFPAAVPVLAAVFIAVLAVLLWLGHGWTVPLLVLGGVVSVLVLASAGRWETLIAMAALLVGSASLLGESAMDHIRGRR